MFLRNLPFWKMEKNDRIQMPALDFGPLHCCQLNVKISTDLLFDQRAIDPPGAPPYSPLPPPRGNKGGDRIVIKIPLIKGDFGGSRLR